MEKNKISRIGEDTELYNIEVFKFNEESGLYFIVRMAKELKKRLLKKHLWRATDKFATIM